MAERSTNILNIRSVATPRLHEVASVRWIHLADVPLLSDQPVNFDEPPVYKITELIAQFTDDPIPEFYRSRVERAILVKDMIRKELEKRDVSLKRIGEIESMFTGTVTDSSTIWNSVHKDIEPLTKKFYPTYLKLRIKVQKL